MSASDRRLSLSVALQRVAAELDSMRRISARLDGVIGASTRHFDLDDPETLDALQGLDRLTQELSSLRPLLESLAEVAEMTDDPDAGSAVEAIRLGSLRSRIASSGAAPIQVPAGEPDFF